MWFFTLLHIAFFILKEMGYHVFDIADSSSEESKYWTIALEFAAVSIPSGLMSLLLVFFNNQCYSRYTALYGACVGMGGALQELAQTTSVLMAWYPSERWDANRYALASMMVIYSKVTDLARNRPQRMDPEDWERLTSSEEEWCVGRSRTLDTSG